MIAQNFGRGLRQRVPQDPASLPGADLRADPVEGHQLSSRPSCTPRYPGISPPRWINEVVVEHNAHPGLKFVLINTHYIHGAYNGSKNPNLRDE